MADSAHITNLPRRALVAFAVLPSIANAVVIVGITTISAPPYRAAPPACFEPLQGSGWPNPR